MNNIRITPISGSQRHFRIFLDDVDISRYVKFGGMSIDFENGMPVVHLTLLGHLEIPENLMALVTADILKPEVEAQSR